MREIPPLHLIACVSMKRNCRAPAADLYVSPWFKKARAYVTKLGAPWKILSAKHGLLDPSEEIAPYDVTLNDMAKVQRRTWAVGVLEDLDGLLREGDQAVFFAGARYREFVIARLEARGVCVRVPMMGLGLGEQLRWLSESAERISAKSEPR